ncbi:MSHA pilin protein MshA [Thalassotalea agarivorans]|uniref:MSHA pilin protein MshA n=1 Tax=Thalassotalea agarivorans TaxID=349064 RepID=A0A1I0FZG7_THASX|nr:MSHA pilin protein MshA [Thalassotalea agarivorans]
MELIVVIIIIALLAVTALPKFVNLQTDARDASLAGVKSALESQASLIYGRAVVKGVEIDDKTAGSFVEAESSADPVFTHFGYPVGNYDEGVGRAMNIRSSETPNADRTEFGHITDEESGITYTLFFFTKRFKSDADIALTLTSECIVVYEEPENVGELPDIYVNPCT